MKIELDRYQRNELMATVAIEAERVRKEAMAEPNKANRFPILDRLRALTEIYNKLRDC